MRQAYWPWLRSWRSSRSGRSNSAALCSSSAASAAASGSGVPSSTTSTSTTATLCRATDSRAWRSSSRRGRWQVNSTVIGRVARSAAGGNIWRHWARQAANTACTPPVGGSNNGSSSGTPARSAASRAKPTARLGRPAATASTRASSSSPSSSRKRGVLPAALARRSRAPRSSSPVTKRSSRVSCRRSSRRGSSGSPGSSSGARGRSCRGSGPLFGAGGATPRLCSCTRAGSSSALSACSQVVCRGKRRRSCSSFCSRSACHHSRGSPRSSRASRARRQGRSSRAIAGSPSSSTPFTSTRQAAGGSKLGSR